MKGTDKAYAVNFIDMDKIKKDVEYMDANDVDVKLVYMHWGVEYQLKPNKAQENTAKKLNELGVDIILGSHPHVIQKCDVIESGGKKTYVCYSMGNFVSNQRREFMPNRYSENELMMEVILQKTPDTKRKDDCLFKGRANGQITCSARYGGNYGMVYR